MKLRLKPRRSLRYNFRMALRFSWNKYLSRASDAAADPGSVKKLHRMRIAGKRLRDIMELCLPFSARRFKNAFKRVKETVSLMGKIHDLDDAADILKARRGAPGVDKITRFVRLRRKKLYAKFENSRKKLEKPGFTNLIKI